jgi:hypothetical protein
VDHRSKKPGLNGLLPVPTGMRLTLTLAFREHHVPLSASKQLIERDDLRLVQVAAVELE